tara:strand:+ start:120 stop:227 length:108 start_codon:yes stop_codon:yes gene_type:complete
LLDILQAQMQQEAKTRGGTGRGGGGLRGLIFQERP